MDVRAEFEEFFQAAYPWLVSQLHAITGDRMSACAAVETAFDGCWQRWSVVRRLTDPLIWVRWAALRAAAQGRGAPGPRRLSTAPAIPTDTDEGVVLAALQTLPWSQRQAVVLHYMGDVPVEELARRGGTTADAVDWLLDTGFDTLVETLGWPTGPSTDADDPDPRYDWTAEALGDTAMLLAGDVTVPDPTSVLQRAAVLRWAKRAAPIAVSAACVSSIVVLAAQLSPGSTAGPRTPTIYVAEPSAVDGGGGYTRVKVPPVDGGGFAGGGVASPLPYMGVKIFSVAQATRLEDFGVSAPPPADAAEPAQAGTSGSSSRAGAAAGTGSSTAGGTTGATPATGGGQATTTPGSGSSGGTVPPASTSPATTPPTTSPVTIPPVTSTTTPPATTTTPPPVTTEPPVVTTTTEPPVVTTTTEPPVVTTTLAAVTTTLTAVTTTLAEVTTTTTTTEPPTTTTTTEPPTTAAEESTTANDG